MKHIPNILSASRIAWCLPLLLVDAMTVSFLVVALLMGVGSYFIRQVSPQDHWIWPFGIIPLPMEPAH